MKGATAASDCDGLTSASFSPLQGDEVFLSKLVSRDATPACVSSRSYYRSCAHVPFEWEARPGQPKNPTHGELLPPLSPPPAMQSAGLAQRIHPSGAPSTGARRDGSRSSNRRRRHAPSKASSLSDGHSMASQGCLVMRPVKLTLFGATKRREFSRALLNMFGAA